MLAQANCNASSQPEKKTKIQTQILDLKISSQVFFLRLAKFENHRNELKKEKALPNSGHARQLGGLIRLRFMLRIFYNTFNFNQNRNAQPRPLTATRCHTFEKNK